MKTLKLLLISAIMALSFSVQARTTIVFGQSNANGIVNFGGLQGEVIDCTKGGKPISYFHFSMIKTSMFGDCLVKASGKHIDGIVFWQGESDHYPQTLADNWGAAASDVVDALLNYIGRNTPVLMVVLHEGACVQCYAPGWETIRQQQLNFMGAKYRLDSSNYEFQPAQIHMTNSGYQAISADIESLLYGYQRIESQVNKTN